MTELENFQSGEGTGSADNVSAKEDAGEIQPIDGKRIADEASSYEDAVEINYFEFLEALEQGEKFNGKKIIFKAPGSNSAGVEGAIETRVQGIKANVDRISDLEDLEGDVYMVEIGK